MIEDPVLGRRQGDKPFIFKLPQKESADLVLTSLVQGTAKSRAPLKRPLSQTNGHKSCSSNLDSKMKITTSFYFSYNYARIARPTR